MTPATAATFDTTTLKTPMAMFYHWERTKGDQVYMHQPIDGEWTTYTWKEAGNQVRRMAAYLKAQGWEPGSRIALVSKNCAHWLMADMAILMAGHVSVPIYPNVNAETVSYILEHSEAKLLFVGKLDEPNWAVMKDGVPKGFNCITFPRLGQPGFPIWDEVIEEVEPLAGDVDRPIDEIATIIYTSGTTGTPKGVVHKFQSLSFAIHQFKELLKLGDNEKFFSYLPLSHIAERQLIEMGSLVTGGSVHFAESLDTFVHNLGTCAPTIFLAVPRIWTKFQMGVLAKFPPSRLNLLISIPILGGIIKKKIREKLGLANAKLCLTGAAPIPKSLLEWYKKLGILIVEVYGMTENAAYSHSNLPNAWKFGSVGQTLPLCETKITDEGEICVRCMSNMEEYYKEPEKTAETLIDGWLHTGDVGEEDANGYLTITGRVKDIFKTSKAKYVAPNPIELKLSSNANIEQVCVVGTGIPQPIGLVVLSEGALEKSREEVAESLQETLKEVNPTLEHHERLQRLVVVKEGWTPENELLTPTLKIKRNAIDKAYGSKYEAWYEGGKSVAWE
jgi:long-subunit acyl-CoA synthetase (AMP-forming)